MFLRHILANQPTIYVIVTARSSGILKAKQKLGVHCITLYYAYQEISWKPGKMSKFRPIHSTIQIWTDFHKNEAKKKFKVADFSKSPILKFFFAKISQIGPWVSRIE